MKKKLILLGILLCGLTLSAVAQPGIHARQAQRSHMVKKHLNHERMSKMEMRNFKRQQWRLHKHKKRQQLHKQREGIVAPRERKLLRSHHERTMRKDLRGRHARHHRN